MPELFWLPKVLRAVGIRVKEYPGWLDRSYPGAFNPVAVMWHHDASESGPSAYMAKQIAEDGTALVPPPLAHAWVDTTGLWTITAAGRANHAGTGDGFGVITKDNGNRSCIGIETDHTVNEPWPAGQLQSLFWGTAAIMNACGWSPLNALCGHKEYAPTRKIDPDGLGMTLARDQVTYQMLALKTITSGLLLQ